MKYIKRIIILNEITSGFSRGTARGVANIEKTPARIEASINVFGLEPLKSGRFIVGIGSKNMKIQKANAGRGGRLNTKFLLSPDTDMENPLFVTIVFSDNGAIVPVLFGSNGNRKALYGSLIDGFSEHDESMLRGHMDDLREEVASDNKKTDENNVDKEIESNQSEQKSEGSSKKFEQLREVDLKEQKQISAELEEEDVFIKPLQRAPESIWKPFEVRHQRSYQRGYGAYVDAPMASNWSLAHEMKKRKRVGVLSEGAFELESERITQADKEAFFESKYMDNEVATENYYPDGFGMSEAGFTLADGVEVNIINPETIMLKKPKSFYDNVKPQLDELFKRYPAEETLNAKLVGTRWVKVDYNNNGKYYIVGLIGDKPKFICYGVPAKYTKEPPEELQGCQWIPLDDGKPEGDGYWLMYQSAESGENVELSIM